MKLRFSLIHKNCIYSKNICFSIHLIVQLPSYSHRSVSVLFQQVYHHVSVRQLREQRLSGGGGILGRVLQQRAKSTHLRLLQS